MSAPDDIAAWADRLESDQSFAVRMGGTNAKELARLLRAGAEAMRQRDEAVRLLRWAAKHESEDWEAKRATLLASLEKNTGESE